jgi:hypothetical protein
LNAPGRYFSPGENREDLSRPFENSSSSLRRLTSISRSSPSNNGKLKPLYALVHGKPEHHPEGIYFLRYLNDGKRIWDSVGTDPIFALDEKRRREKGLDAQTAGVTLTEQPERSTPIKAAIAEYLDEVRDAEATKTFLAYCLLCMKADT